MSDNKAINPENVQSNSEIGSNNSNENVKSSSNERSNTETDVNTGDVVNNTADDLNVKQNTEIQSSNTVSHDQAKSSQSDSENADVVDYNDNDKRESTTDTNDVDQKSGEPSNDEVSRPDVNTNIKTPSPQQDEQTHRGNDQNVEIRNEDNSTQPFIAEDNEQGQNNQEGGNNQGQGIERQGNTEGDSSTSQQQQNDQHNETTIARTDDGGRTDADISTQPFSPDQKEDQSNQEGDNNQSHVKEQQSDEDEDIWTSQQQEKEQSTSATRPDDDTDIDNSTQPFIAEQDSNEQGENNPEGVTKQSHGKDNVSGDSSTPQQEETQQLQNDQSNETAIARPIDGDHTDVNNSTQPFSPEQDNNKQGQSSPEDSHNHDRSTITGANALNQEEIKPQQHHTRQEADDPQPDRDGSGGTQATKNSSEPSSTEREKAHIIEDSPINLIPNENAESDASKSQQKEGQHIDSQAGDKSSDSFTRNEVSANSTAVESKDAMDSKEPKKQPKKPSWKPYFMRNRRQAAQVDGNAGGVPAKALEPNEGAVKIQASWRGKQTRRQMRKQDISATTIQRVYRGTADRWKYEPQLSRAHERKKEAKERREISAQIRIKEKDLAILKRIPAEQYMEFERLRKENSAKTIQRNWRYSRDKDGSEATNLMAQIGHERATSIADARRFPHGYKGKSGKYHLRNRKSPGGDKGLKSDGLGSERYGSVPQSWDDDEARINHQKQSLCEFMTELIEEEIIQNYSIGDRKGNTPYTRNDSLADDDADSIRPKASKYYEVEVEALGLLQLQRRVRETAAQKMRQKDLRAAKAGFRTNPHCHVNDLYNNSADYVRAHQPRATRTAQKNYVEASNTAADDRYDSRWGVRRNYQDLVEMQTKAAILLHEHAFKRINLEERQQSRHRSLGNCKHLQDQLHKPMSLDEARLFISSIKGNKENDKEAPETPSNNADELKSGLSAQEKRDWLIDEELWAPIATNQQSPRTARTAGSVGTAHSYNTNGPDILPQDYRPFRDAATIAANRAVNDNVTGAELDHQIQSKSGRRFAARKGTNDNSGNTSTASKRVTMKEPKVGNLTARSISSAYLDSETLGKAAEQHVKALHAVRISRGMRNNSNITERYMHWGTVALPISLQIGPDGFQHPMTEVGMKELRGSVNHSHDGSLKELANDKNSSQQKQAYAEQLSQQMLTDAKLFRPLATQWASGNDIEDSLYWISYATQPSNILPSNPPIDSNNKEEEEEKSRAREQQLKDMQEIAEEKKKAVAAVASAIATKAGSFNPGLLDTPSSAQLGMGGPLGAIGGSDKVQQKYIALRRDIGVEAMQRAQRVPRAARHVLHEIERVDRLAAVMQEETLSYLKRQQALQAQQMLGGEKAKAQRDAAVKIQALSRGKRARRDVSALLSQRRVFMALQNLLNEIAVADGQPAPAPLKSHAALGQLLASNLAKTTARTTVAGSGHSAVTGTRRSGGKFGIAEESMRDPSSLAMTLSKDTGEPNNRSGSRNEGFTFLSSSSEPSHAAEKSGNKGNTSMLSTIPLPPQSHKLDTTDFALYGGGADYGAGLYTSNSTPAPYHTPMMAGMQSGVHTGVVSGAESVVRKGAWTDHVGVPTSSPRRQKAAAKQVLSSSFTVADQVGGDSGVAALAASTETPLSTPARSARSHYPDKSILDEAHSARPLGIEPFTPRTGVTFAEDKNVEKSYLVGGMGAIQEDTPGSVGSRALSEFSFLHEDEGGAAYISSPGHSQSGDKGHSLSRSLSASFGQVSDRLDNEVKDGTNGSDMAGINGAAASAAAALKDAEQRGEMEDGIDVSNTDTNTPFRIARKGSRSAAAAATLADQAMRNVEEKYRSNACSVTGFIHSALAADPHQFDKNAALKLLQGLVMVTGVTPLVRWLQSFKVVNDDTEHADPDAVLNASLQRRSVERLKNAGDSGAAVSRISPSTSLSNSAGPGEMHVQNAALLIAELASELRVLDTTTRNVNHNQLEAVAEPKVHSTHGIIGAASSFSSDSAVEQEMMYNLIQTCILLRLLGAGTDSGRLRIADLSALLEDAWMMSVPMNGVRVSNCLAMFRFKLLQQATRRASHPRKLLDDIIRASGATTTACNPSDTALAQWYEEERIETSAVADILVRIYTTTAAGLGTPAATPTSSQENTAAISAGSRMHTRAMPMAGEVADALVKYCAWSDYASSIAVSDLSNQLCSLSSFRSLQKRIQIWFRAVPTMHDSVLQAAVAVTADPMILSVENFSKCCNASKLPLSRSECYMLAQLLSRKPSLDIKANAWSKQPANPGDDYDSIEISMNAIVDLKLLQRIKAGEYLHAALV